MRIKNQELRIKNFNITLNANQTQVLGQKLATQLKGGEIIALQGNLGAGKTTFLKGIAKGLGIKNSITSPTFVLMKVYPVLKHKTIKQLVHADCYRVTGTDMNKIGLGDYLNDLTTVIAIELSGKLKTLKPTYNIKLNLGKSNNERQIAITLLRT